MARLLKSAYFKATSHPQFCSYSTKANPYIEVLKTLRSWEQDRRNRSQKFSQHNEQQKPLNNEYLSSSTNENKNLNEQNEDFHLSEDINMVITRTDDVYVYTSPNHKIFTSENSEVLIEGQVLENRSKIVFPIRDNTRHPSAGHSSNNFVTVNKDELNELTSVFHPQRDIETSKHLKISKEKTVNKNRILPESESPQMKKKKSKRTKAKSSLSNAGVKTKAENLSNLSTHRNVNELFGGLNVREHTKTVNSASLKGNTSSGNASIELPNSGTKKTAKSKIKFLNLLGKEESKANSSEQASKNFSVKESEGTQNFSSSVNVKSLNFPLKSNKKAATETVCDKKLSVNTKSKPKVSKAKSKTHLIKENQRQMAKQQNAIQSLRSLVEAYINANEITKAHRIFEHLLHDQKKKQFVDVDIFNVILSGWARQGRLDKVKQLFVLMANEKKKPNLQSYASYLEVISRSKCVDVSEIPKIVSEMKSHGYSHKDLLQNCVFVGDQREKVIEALGYVERDLSLPLYDPGEAYSYSLIEKLNDKNYEKGDSHFNFCFEAKGIKELAAEQMEIEDKAVIKIKSVNTVPELDDVTLKAREYIKECEGVWRTQLTKAINNLKNPKKPHQGVLGSSPNQSIYPYITVIDTEILVNLILQEARTLGETAEFYSPNIRVLYKDIGLKVMTYYFMALNKKNQVTEKVHFVYEKYLEHLLNPELCAKYSPREYWEFLKSKYTDGPTIDVSNPSWPYSLLIFIGSILYDVLRRNIGFNPNRVARKSDSNFMYPAFHIVYENHDVKLNRQIRAHDMFSKLYRDAKLDYLDFDVSIVPMLSPPRPWLKYDAGGMLITKVPFIRFPEFARSLSSFYAKVPAHQLNPCFDSLNNLSLCPWIINKPVLDVVIKIFQEGGSEDLDIPLNPSNYHLDPALLVESSDNAKSAFRYKMEYEKKKCEMTSLWFDSLYKLSIANHFRDKVFWFPHNLDFRGRVYPTPPHFNHLGSDLSRSILLFAAGKPLGEKGLDWLKIHLINLTGFKKRSPHAERLVYANEMLPEILDSADNPFGGSRWWMKSDAPLQTLACCKEVATAVRHPNPAEYISHYPVHQDGSCNGLQHYAALGRDELGAIEVNLHPSSSPQDVYSGVAALVEKERERDAVMGMEIAQALEGFVTRKVVKQTVMTFVYGVTPYGARLQVLKQLKDIPELPEKYHQAAATYLMKKIFFSIKEMFTATKKIQDWFTQCADEITRVTEEAVEWITPLGLPVVQPYYKETNVRSSKFCPSKGNEENINHYVSHFEPYQLPNVRKQKNAFAPNFIHSLDSTHMMLTSLFCHRKGVTFVSVHDCYWTHASTVEAMNKVCREQFVSLHSEPILENLSAFFLERFANASGKNPDLNVKQMKATSRMRNVLSAVPDKGTFDLKRVLNSEYFFS